MGIQFVKFHLVGDFHRGIQCLRKIREHLFHLFLCLEPLLPGVSHPGGIIQVFPGIEADQVIVRFGIFHIDKMNIVGCDAFDAVFFPQLKQCAVHKNLVIEHQFVHARIIGPVPHQLQVEILPEDAGFGIQALGPPQGYHGGQVVVAGLVPGQQHDVVEGIQVLIFPALSGPAGNIGFTAQDRLDAPPAGFLMKFFYSEHVAVIGDGDGIHVVINGLF